MLLRLLFAFFLCATTFSIDLSAAKLRVRTLAGFKGGAGHRDAFGVNARFSVPSRMALACDGSIVVPDAGSNVVRRVTASGEVTTIAGTPFMRGSTDGSQALFRHPEGVAIAPDCSVWVADTGNHTIRRIAPNGAVTTVAGLAGSPGLFNGTGSAVRFSSPTDLGFAPGSSDAIVADSGNAMLRRVTASGAVTAVAGTPTFRRPIGVSFDTSGRLFVADSEGNAIHIGQNGNWQRIAPSPVAFPSDMAVADDGTIFLTDRFGQAIRAIAPDRTTRTIAGSYNLFGSADGDSSSARLNQPTGLVLLAPDTVVFSEVRNHLLRRATLTGDVTTLAGERNEPASIDGEAIFARFTGPADVAETNDGTVYVSDSLTVRKITPDGRVSTIAGKADSPGSNDGQGAEARFRGLGGITVDPTGTIFVTEVSDQTIRKITSTGLVSTIAGATGIRGTADGVGSEARFSDPIGITVDGNGDLYVADQGNHSIRKITVADGRVTTYAGVSGRIGQGDGPANEARFFNPWGVDVDDQGFVYVLDENNHVVQKIENGMVRTIAATHETLRTFDLAVAPDGAIYTAAGQPSFVGRVAGNRIEEFVGAELEPGNRVGVPGRARLNLNASVDVGPSGRIIIADSGNHCVKVVELTNEPWIDEFNVVPTNTSGTVALEWCTEGAQSVTISPGVGPVSGCGTMLVTPASTTTYVLRATGVDGSAEERLTVAVPLNRRLRNRR